MTVPLEPARARPLDLGRAAVAGLAWRPGRTVLTAVGIAVGVAALTAVLGAARATRAELLAEIDRLGTDLLRVSPGQRVTGEPVELPAEAPSRLRRLPGVSSAAATFALDLTVRRSHLVGPHITGGITVAAAEPGLLEATRSTMRQGRFVDGGLAGLPVVVLGDAAARRLAVPDLGAAPVVWIGDRWFSVVGVLDPNPLAPDLDRSALLGVEAARALTGADLPPTTIHVRSSAGRSQPGRAVLASAANPLGPDQVEVARPADALEARAAAETALDRMVLLLGAVALAVAGVGVANTMVVAVVERRSEIGLRRALGATGGQVAAQFVTEAGAVGLAGGALGALAGAVVVTATAWARGQAAHPDPALAVAGTLAGAAVAALAGAHPAWRAARLEPAAALRSA